MSKIATARGRAKIKVKKRGLSLDTIASQLASDFLAACYASIGNKSVGGLDSGDDIEDVVDHYLSRHGMKEDLNRLSSTRIEVKVCIDNSGSMYWGHSGRAIVPAMAATRVLHKAFRIVEQTLPSNVFRYGVWLWSTYAACLTQPAMGSKVRRHWDSKESLVPYQINDPLRTDEQSIDNLLYDLSSKAHYSGGTCLSELYKSIETWELEMGDPTAHRLDIVLTDGQIDRHEFDETNVIQNRRSGKYESLLLNVSGARNTGPVGFTSYDISIFNMQEIISQSLFEFVQRIY